MSSIREIHNKMKTRAASITALAESIDNDALTQQALEFTVSVDMALTSIELREGVSADIKDDCRSLFDAQTQIFESMTNLGDLIVVALDESQQRPDMKEYQKMVGAIETMVPQVQEIVEGIVKSNTYLTTIDVRSSVTGHNKLDESVVEDTARRFANADKYIKGAKSVFNGVGPKLKSAGNALNAHINRLKESIINEESIKGDYFCVVQPNYAIFGVGKTSDEAWSETEEWADTTDENWKDSFIEKPCSEKVYNIVSKSGTPDNWEEHNGIVVMPEEIDDLKAAIKTAKS